MDIKEIIVFLQKNPGYSALVVLALSTIAFVFLRFIVAHWLTKLAERSASKNDDILVRHLKPYRVAWLAPLAVIYASAILFPNQEIIIVKASLFLILWLSVFTLLGLLHATNLIYERRKNYKGASIGGYLDIGKLITLFIGVILSISIFTNKSPIALLTGLGAIAAVIMLIFQNTILALVASVQISANNLIKEGDWIEVPSYDADGDVENINLHTIKVRNFDMTYSIIPTHKIMDVAFRNWRGMVESGARRIQRSILIDQTTIKFCDLSMLKKLQKIDRISTFLKQRIEELENYALQHQESYDLPLDGPQITNLEVFRSYVESYLRDREDIFSDKMPFIVRILAPRPDGLPVELYVFAKTTEWETFESIQAQIFDHLLATVQIFGLRVFQEPTGLDFREGIVGIRETS